MNNYNEIQCAMEKVVDNKSNLSLVKTTRGFSIIGFANEQEISKIEKKLEDTLKNYIEQHFDKDEREELKQKSVVCQFLAKDDGQDMWRVLTNDRSKECFDICDINDKDNRRFYFKDTYESEVEFIENELADTGLLGNCSTFDEIQDVVTKFKKLWEAIKSLESDEILLWDPAFWTFEKVKRYVTSYHEDCHTYAIALSII